MLKRTIISLTGATAIGVGGLVATPALANQYVLDFETDASGNDLAPGTVIDDQWLDFGVSITNARKNGKNLNKPLVLFNSNCGPDFGLACTGGDSDLATGPSFGTEPQGNVLIINEDRNTNDPDDWANGGRIIFDFEDPVTLGKVSILDVDEGNGGWLKSFDGVGNIVQEFSLLSSGDNNIKDYIFSEEFDNVEQLVLKLPGSGAITRVEFKAPARVPEPASLLGLAAVGAITAGGALKKKAAN